MVQLKLSSLLIFLVVVKFSSSQLQPTCNFPTPTSVYTCSYQGDTSITGQTTWNVLSHPIGFGNGNVEQFYIRWAFVILIPVSTFTSFINIQHFHIEEAAFTNIATNLPAPYMPLRTITLHRNSQFTIANNAFINFPNVNNLKITKNIFADELGADAFYGLENLLDLEMSGNSQLGILRNLFWNQVNLITLNLSDNDGMHLDVDSFSGLESLISLDMERSKVKNLPDMVFLALKSLEVLNMSGNRITQISVSFSNCFNF